MERKARSFIWVDPSDCDPPHGLDMEGERDANKVALLAAAFEANGFDLDMPALVGYPNEGRIQLLSGTYRHLAASQAGIQLPITLWLFSDIQEMWATELWEEVMRDIPVCLLEEYVVKEGFHRSPYDKVDLSIIKE
jgi:hypothetical protein